MLIFSSNRDILKTNIKNYASSFYTYLIAKFDIITKLPNKVENSAIKRINYFLNRTAFT